MLPISAVPAVGAIQPVGAQRRAADGPVRTLDSGPATPATDTRLSGASLLLQALASQPGEATAGAVGGAALPLPTGTDLNSATRNPALRPLLPAAPAPASAGTAALATALSQALSNSGLFYEAHLLEWVSGLRDAVALQQEPQAQLPALPAPLADAPAGGAPVPDGPAVPHVAAHALLSQSAGNQNVDPAVVHPLAVPLVHQQLQSLDSQVVHWNVQAWPGQLVQLSAHPLAAPADAPRNPTGSDQDDSADDAAHPRPTRAPVSRDGHWQSTLRLQLPQLGEVQAEIRLTGGTCRVALVASATSADTLRRSLPALGLALDQAGMRPEALQVQSLPTATTPERNP